LRALNSFPTRRSSDLNVFPTQVEEIVLEIPGLTPYFQCVLTRPGRMDELTINVEGEPGLSEDARRALAQQVAHTVKSRIGTTVRSEEHTSELQSRFDH